MAKKEKKKHILRIDIISDKKIKNVDEIKELILMETDERVKFYEGYLVEK